ncbi:MAG: YncE family protein [Leadbetterella sp.]
MTRIFFQLTLFFFILLSILGCTDVDIEDRLIIKKGSIVVCNGGDNSISVIDPETQKETQRYYIELSSQKGFLHHINLSKDGRYISLALPSYDFSLGHTGTHTFNQQNNQGKSIVIDIVSGTLVGNIDVKLSNHNVLFEPETKRTWTAYVSHSSNIEVQQINSKSPVLIPVESDPSDLVWINDHSQVAISGGESSFITIYDKLTFKRAKTIKVDPFPTGLYPGYTSHSLIAVNANQNSINFIDTKEYRVVDFIDLDFSPGFGVFRTEKEVWITNPSENKLYVYKKENASWKIAWELKTQDDPHQITFNSSKTEAFISCQRADVVEVINTFDGTKTGEIKVGIKPNGLILI